MTRNAGPSAAHVLFLLDVAFLAAVCFAALRLVPALQPVGPGAALFPVADLCLLYALGLYRRDALVGFGEALGRLPVAAGAGALAAWAMTAAFPTIFGTPEAHLLFAASVPGFAAAALGARLVLHLLRRRGFFRRRLLVVGAGRRAWDLVWMLRHEARTLAFDVVFVHDPRLGEIDPRITADATSSIVPDASDLLTTTQALNPDRIVVAPDERRGLSMEGLLACKMVGFPVSEYAAFLEKEIGRIDLKRLDLSWLLYADGFIVRTTDRLLKRMLDIGVSTTLLVWIAPLVVAAAVGVKLTDRGPILYRQERVSRGGRVFRIIKFRTMRTDAERNGAVWAATDDPRITKFGLLLRRSRIDELPQLLNVLRGDMAFVGPRPERPEFVRELASRLPLYEERHLVRAGLTGWAQVNYPYGASLNDARSKLSYDLFYIKNYGVLFDLRIILQTLRVVFWPSGVR
ncbi:TIGR03013 family PEP-CTERM/XrtA system glycosyltransferase [Roseomonas nepalensis]|uniref:TIGR03013 family PEP-CTERM/XrtA system glycosyltransferase n=1 Tax=Muricoccus nepalensis TaxID=1854500 RepID=A0A502EMJ1_9PROT|nr:TIGR03013 family XrtA/PEP-CTERM system glycosyltransferase [Roseomonas nepalensis]TPG37706.1 TIGR03013 family PEP-CTERM/XrtA system glycosyltransferase [Roseomonas nepalensis]